MPDYDFLMQIQYSVPAKTFLLGEYVVTKGGPALLLGTAPRFILNVLPHTDSKQDFDKTFHPDSPAGKLIRSNMDFYRQFDLNFIDPYLGIGGLGASSAQFALLFAMQTQVTDITPSFLEKALNIYRELAWDQTGTAPSGADVIAQLTGGLCFYHSDRKIINKFSWPFSTMDLCLIHTGNKISTHTYLKDLVDIDTGHMGDVVEDAIMALETSDRELFIESINTYGELLQTKNWVAATTVLLLEKIRTQQGVLAAKGCGAMGADIIFVLLETKSRDTFASWCQEQKIHLMFIGQEASTGLEQKKYRIFPG